MVWVWVPSAALGTNVVRQVTYVRDSRGAEGFFCYDIPVMDEHEPSIRGYLDDFQIFHARQICIDS